MRLTLNVVEQTLLKVNKSSVVESTVNSVVGDLYSFVEMSLLFTQNLTY